MIRTYYFTPAVAAKISAISNRHAYSPVGFDGVVLSAMGVQHNFLSLTEEEETFYSPMFETNCNMKSIEELDFALDGFDYGMFGRDCYVERTVYDDCTVVFVFKALGDKCKILYHKCV